MTTRLPTSHRFHNSLIALSVAMAVGLLGLLGARPATVLTVSAQAPAPTTISPRHLQAAHSAPQAAARQQALTASVAGEIASTAAGQAGDSVPAGIGDASRDNSSRPRASTHRRSRQTLAMPYFSFAARS